MSEGFLVREARRREHIFRNLDRYLEELKDLITQMDESARVFLFGSVLRREQVLRSDIDILILTKLRPSEVIAALRRAGFDEPFEFHVVDEEMFEVYRRFIRETREL